MIGTLIVHREGSKLNQKLFEVPESVFNKANTQYLATGCVNISWQVTGGDTRTYLADKVTGLTFIRDYS